MSREQLLERHPLLQQMTPEQLERIEAAGDLEVFAAGEQIVGEGSLGDALYLVLSGAVTVTKGSHELATLTSGEFFGEMSLVSPSPRSASVVASEESDVFRLPYFALQNLLENDPVAFNRVLVTIVRVLSDRLRRANELLSSVGELADWLAGSLV